MESESEAFPWLRPEPKFGSLKLFKRTTSIFNVFNTTSDSFMQFLWITFDWLKIENN